ncbi:MAG: PAS domain-containing protein, partial [Phycisphaeraceae bacterium]|nr:PAS domain-containing protein [Phycisphaeraceae bacterium]
MPLTGAKKLAIAYRFLILILVTIAGIAGTHLYDVSKRSTGLITQQDQILPLITQIEQSNKQQSGLAYKHKKLTSSLKTTSRVLIGSLVLIGLFCSLDLLNLKKRNRKNLCDREQLLPLHQASKHEFEALANTLTDSVVTLDHLGVIQYANPATKLLFGYCVNELIGQNIDILMPIAVRHLHEQCTDYFNHPSDQSPDVCTSCETKGFRKDAARF